MSKASAIRKSAKGQDCQVRLNGICNHNPETVVLAHLNGAGMAMKHEDMFGAYACSDCHDAIDRRHNRALDRDYVRLAHLDGMVRTQKILLSMGLIKL